jgi:hypothetical protein
MEPFLAVRGTLQKDGATLNVIAQEVAALRVPGAPVQRSGLSRLRSTDADAEAHNGVEAVAAVRETLPDTMEYWSDPDAPGSTAFNYLTALRQSPPGIKSFG